ncbi:MAG: hypothetical protein IKA95_01345 [Clostridia bacterium]|nr:hypothetical protein [Clostridia bacterium]
MSYKYKINAASYVGESHQSSNEFFFADNLSSVSEGVCNATNICTISKGKKHVFSVASCSDAISQMCDYFGNVLFRRNSAKMRIKVQYDLKDAMEELSNVICRDDDTSEVSMMCIDNGNVYAAGFGDINIYHFNKKKKHAQKIAFSQSPFAIEPDLVNNVSHNSKLCRQARLRCVGTVKSGDEYLLVGSWLKSLLGDEQIYEIFERYKGNAPSVLINTASALDSSRNLTAVHVAAKKQHKLFWSVCLAMLAIACAIGVAYIACVI